MLTQSRQAAKARSRNPLPGPHLPAKCGIKQIGVWEDRLIPMIGKATPLTQRASAHLDMIRGIAALAVMTGHIRGLFFLDYKDLASPSPAVNLLYAVTGLGHQAVMVFFVLSGFLIGGSVLNSMNRWTWKRYLVNRFCRLYLVLLPALILTAVLDYISYRQPGGHVYFDLPIAHFNAEALAGHRAWNVFFGNALFLQNIVVPTYGSNSPLWSLANEFWYYLLFPALVLTAYTPNHMKRRLVGALMSILMLVLLPGGILAGFLIWLMGVAVHRLPTLDIGRGPRWGLHGVTAAAFFATLMLSRVGRIPPDWSDPAVGFAFALWLYCLVKIKTSSFAIPALYAWWARLFSKCSYSLYAVHFPMVLLIRTSLVATLWHPNLPNLALGSAICTAVFLFGLMFSRLTEAHNDRMRALLLTRFTSPAALGQTA
jgi:peptidoglycan/LPS O-acetylase OafA/YrhL